MTVAPHPAPAPWRLATEWRSLGELGLSLSLYPLVASAPRGDGHPVLVLPGFLASDVSTALMRRVLHQLNFDAHPWSLGRNLGGVRKMRDRLRGRLETIAERTGRRVSIVGWSLGGVFARDLALSHPDVVRYVVGLSSPLTRDLRSANTGKLYAMAAHEDYEFVDGADGVLASEFDALAGDLACPATSFYTKCDGVVNWETCLIGAGARSENVEIRGASHTGIGVNPAAIWAVADRLAQPDGTFTPFQPRGPFVLGYGREHLSR